VIKFVSDLRQVGGFLRVLQFPPPIKLDRYDITEILLKVALNIITLTHYKVDSTCTLLYVFLMYNVATLILASYKYVQPFITSFI
jgi:hypothetical protein